MTTRPAKKDRSFEEAMERLEAIVAEIECDELGLEKQFELFQEGMDARPLLRREARPRSRSPSRSS